MLIISDTSVITNLIQLNELSLLENLFGRVIIPEKVYSELGKLLAQKKIIDESNWIDIRAISDKILYAKLENSLDPGEAEAITLAVELEADVLLIDEKKGRKIAQEHGVLITGLLGVLIEAKEVGLLEEIKPLFEVVKT
ncbi:MAG: DUF3368 domain-containing protein [Bacteroidia bacterium]|nr:DUF3368 domain-containing protein [Bacteroidia bacterium]